MKIYINEKEISYTPLFPLTWGNFFQKLLQNKNYILEDHGIVGFEVDGIESIKTMVSDSEKMVPETIRIIKIVTKNSLDITRDGFKKISALLDSIQEEISKTADFYREGNLQEASSRIVKIMEAIKPMVNFVQSVGVSFSLNFDEILFNQTTTLRSKIETFLETFSELIISQQKKDYVEVADYLEYQLLEDMGDWKKIINLLLQEVEALSGSPV